MVKPRLVGWAEDTRGLGSFGSWSRAGRVGGTGAELWFVPRPSCMKDPGDDTSDHSPGSPWRRSLLSAPALARAPRVSFAVPVGSLAASLFVLRGVDLYQRR